MTEQNLRLSDLLGITSEVRAEIVEGLEKLIKEMNEELEEFEDNLVKTKIPAYIYNTFSDMKPEEFKKFITGNKLKKDVQSKVNKWIQSNPISLEILYDLVTVGSKDDYEIEKEYVVPVKGMVSNNGQQYLTRDVNDKKSFFLAALMPYANIQQTFTESELVGVDPFFTKDKEEVTYGG